MTVLPSLTRRVAETLFWLLEYLYCINNEKTETISPLNNVNTIIYIYIYIYYIYINIYHNIHSERYKHNYKKMHVRTSAFTHIKLVLLFQVASTENVSSVSAVITHL